MKVIGNIRRADKNSGFTMIEVVVAALVFAISAAGIFATATALNQPSEVSDEEVKAAFLGKRILESLRTSVNYDTWDTGDLSLGTHTTSNLIHIDGMFYNYTYEVMDDPDLNGRRVEMNVFWIPKTL